MPADQFEKDFGYLMPFIDKVAAASAGLANPASRAELASLVAGEKTRWARIRQLLAGATSEGSSETERTVAVIGRTVPEKPRVNDSDKESPRFTVGSLRPSKG